MSNYQDLALGRHASVRLTEVSLSVVVPIGFD